MKPWQRPNGQPCAWKNYETWNVALWIGKDEGLYRMAMEHDSYDEFRDEIMRSIGILQTPDGVDWNDSGLDIERLDEMIVELSA